MAQYHNCHPERAQRVERVLDTMSKCKIMEKLVLNDKTFVPFISYEQIGEATDRIAERINADYRGSEDVPILLCVLNGSIMFTAELMKRLDFNCEFATIKLSSYEGMSSTGKVKVTSPLTADIKGRKVIIVEDIVDTGNTIVALKKMLMDDGAADVRICTMLLKPEVYKRDVKLDYIAMEIPNRFIVGFGLDYDEIGRNTRDIYVLE